MLVTMTLDPNAGGVSQAEFNAHTHTYQKVTHIGADADDKWASPTWVATVDNGDAYAAESVDLEAAGVRLGSAQTGVPSQ